MFENIANKIIPTIILAIIFGLFAMYGALQEQKLRMMRVESVLKDRFIFILENHDDIIAIKEKLKCQEK